MSDSNTCVAVHDGGGNKISGLPGVRLLRKRPDRRSPLHRLLHCYV
ncbi:hypothetical protein KC906_01830 [Candidatus Kaiserbacteria bacterium]|nr:hypothetical protein [Candidatus Kaiserbacteria bacterium]